MLRRSLSGRYRQHGHKERHRPIPRLASSLHWQQRFHWDAKLHKGCSTFSVDNAAEASGNIGTAERLRAMNRAKLPGAQNYGWRDHR